MGFWRRTDGEVTTKSGYAGLPLVEVRMHHWESKLGVHTFSTVLRLPLDEAREMKAELDAAIMVAQAKAKR